MNIIEIMITLRQEALIASIVQEFIETAEPVSSKYLEEAGFFDLSSATIRAEMNALEDLGYLAHLHTSGGRIPTDNAYRYFVDDLMARQNFDLAADLKRKIQNGLNDLSDDPREINKRVAHLLSNISENLVVAGGTEQDEFYKFGLSSLFEMPEFRELDKVFQLTSFFEEFESIFDRMEKEIIGDEVKIFIGKENPIKDVREETVMFARYNLPHNFTGSLTLVGPTRMDYGKNIGLIKYATEELNKLARKT